MRSRNTSTNRTSQANRRRSLTGWWRESLRVEALERRVLLAADMTGAAPAAFVASNQAPAGFATNANVQNGSAGMGATFASSNPGDAAAGAPGTTLNPSGTSAMNNPGDAGLGAPGTSFNPAGTPATANPGDAGVGAPGTTFNPSGTPASSNPGDAGSFAPGTVNPQAADAVFAG